MPITKQQGITLIEMMIAMVISLVLIAGVGTVYISSKRTYQTRDQLSTMDETARVALDMLTKHLEHAGYATPDKLPIGDYMYYSGASDPVVVSCAGGDSILKSSDVISRATKNSFNSYGDVVAVRFIGDDVVYTDCANGHLPAGCRADVAPSMQAALIYNSFFVDKDSDGMENLYCMGSRNTSKKPVVNGVENIQFLYGVDTTGDGAVDYYANADSVGATNWQRVVSIQVSILVRSLDPVLEAATAQSYRVLDVTVTKNDRYKRAVYSTVIQLRNVVEG